MQVEALRLAGRKRIHVPRVGGVLFHAVPAGDLRAVCGVAPGRKSAGWDCEAIDGAAPAVVTCRRCLAWRPVLRCAVCRRRIRDYRLPSNRCHQCLEAGK